MYLTKREREVLPLITRGYSDPEIARALHMSARTAESHTRSLLKKFGVRNRVQLTRRVLLEPALVAEE